MVTTEADIRNEPGGTKGPFRVCIVVPCYNEEGVLGHTVDVLLGQIASMAAEGLVTNDSYICLVDDGSRDGTWAEIETLARRSNVTGIKLSANFGHQNALIAGLFNNRGKADILVTIDADLQDDVSVVGEMMKHHHQGRRIVYGVRTDRNADVLGKRIAAGIFYKLMRMMHDRTVKGHADFRSADARVIADLERFGEANMYLRGIFPTIGYSSAEVHYVRKERHAGESKYSYRKLLSLAWQGVTSFTTTPLKLVFYCGMFVAVIAFFTGLWVVYSAITERTIEGWASISLLVITFSAMNMIALGIIGEYVGKIYQEVKHRPRFIIETTTDNG
jgi:polyisoprenyl-phosphate glycosyltransferase